MSKEAVAVKDETTTRRSTGRRLVTLLVAVVATSLVWTIAEKVFDVDVKVKQNGTETAVQLPSVIIVTLLAGLVGWGLLALLERFSARGRRIWTIIAVVVLVVSLLGPLSGITAGAKVTLLLLHLAAGLVIIPGLARPGRS
jgi:hypothetical protein